MTRSSALFTGSFIAHADAEAGLFGATITDVCLERRPMSWELSHLVSQPMVRRLPAPRLSLRSASVLLRRQGSAISTI